MCCDTVYDGAVLDSVRGADIAVDEMKYHMDRGNHKEEAGDE